MPCVDTSGRQEPGTVLVVDDNSDDLRFTQRVVAAVCPQLRVRGLQSAEELICYLEGKHGFSDRASYPYPILILLDLSMPGMHGFEALLWLRNHPPHHLLPVVVLTKSGEMLMAQRSYELGASSFLTKPLKGEELKDTMGKFTDWPDQRL
jgi:CheY-like chemotaxis protein